MKNIILLLSLIIFIQYVSCNDAILSKFLQHTYKLKDVRIELMSYNKDYLNFFEIKAFKYNRTTTAHNATINSKVDTGNKVEVVVQSYKFLSNEYRPLAIRYQVNAQKAFEANVIGLRAVSNCGNLTSFILYKNITYHVCHFVIDETRCPPLFPSGQYKHEITFLFENQEVAVVCLYGEAYTPIAYPKK